MDRKAAPRRRRLRNRVLAFAVVWGVLGAIALVICVPVILLLDHFVNPQPDRPRAPFLHALAVPPLTVLGWIFIAGAFGLLFYLTYALTIGVGDMWRRALFGRSTTGRALHVNRVREESVEETAKDRVEVEYQDEAGEQRHMTLHVFGARKPIVPGDPVRLRYPRGRPDKARHSTPVSDTVMMVVLTVVWAFLAASSVGVIWTCLNYYLHLTG
jgi:hypothetical protein